MEINEKAQRVQLAGNPQKRLNIGKNTLRLFEDQLPDMTAKITSANAILAKCNEVFYIRIRRREDDPYSTYRTIVDVFRDLNNSRYRRFPTLGYRLHNVSSCGSDLVLTSNIVCQGIFFTSLLFDQLFEKFYGRGILCVSFKKPRQTLYHRRYKEYFYRFYELSHLPQNLARIDMIEEYHWMIHCRDTRFVVDILLRYFGDQLVAITNRVGLGIELSPTPNIDDEDYFTTMNPRFKIRYFQPFGSLFNRKTTQL